MSEKDPIALTLLGRLTWSTSYSAYEMVRGLGVVTGMVPLFACGVVYFRQIEGLQSLCAILAAQGLTALLPIPYEPAGYLVLPAVLLYFAVISTVAWFVCLTIARVMPSVDIVIDQFVALSATSRALAYFKAADQIAEIGALSFAFLCVPTPPSSSFKQTEWQRQMLRAIECFTARAAATWVAARCEAWAQGVQLTGLYLGILLLPGLMDLTPKLANCRSVIALLCAQQAVAALPFVAPFMAALAVPFVQNTRLRDVAVYGVSILITKRLDKWISDCGRAEGACAYLCVFVLLQMLSEFSKKFFAAENKSSGPIFFANEMTDMMGLPNIDDSF